MLYFGLAMALVAVFALIFARWGNSPPPEPGTQTLSEMFPNLTEDDWRWLQSAGGYAGVSIYPNKGARR